MPIIRLRSGTGSAKKFLENGKPLITIVDFPRFFDKCQFCASIDFPFEMTISRLKN